MLRYIFIFFCIVNLFADYNNISIQDLLKKTALLNNINIVIPSDLNSSRTYTLTINSYITAKDLLKVSESILNQNRYKLAKLNKSFYIVSKIKDNRQKYIYHIKNSNADSILNKLNNLYPGYLYKLSNKLILIQYIKQTKLKEILNNIKAVDYTRAAYYVQLNIYSTNTQDLEQIGPNITADNGNAIITRKFGITSNLLPAIINLLQDKQKSKLIASPKLFLAPDTNNTAIFKEVTTIPITIRKTQIIPGTNPVVTNTNTTVYKDIGLIMKLKFINTTQNNRVKLLLNLTDSNIINYSENGITSSSRTIQAIIQAKLNSSIFIAGLSKTTKTYRIVGIPVLKDIPIIKYLFRHKKKNIANRTLVITLTIKKVNNDLARNNRNFRE